MSDRVIKKPEKTVSEARDNAIAASLAQADYLKRLQDQRDFRDRYRMFFGELLNMENEQKPLLKDIKYSVVNGGVSVLRSAFNYRNPMALLQGAFSAAMDIYRVTSSLKRLELIKIKETNFKGYMWDHINGMGPEIAKSLRDKDGNPVEIQGFRGLLKSIFEDAKGLGARPGGYDPTKHPTPADRDQFVALLGARAWNNEKKTFEITPPV